MTAAVDLAPFPAVADRFGSLAFGFRHSDGGTPLTSGSYLFVAEEFTETADRPGLWRFGVLGASEASAFDVSITGSVVAYAPFAVGQTSDEGPDFGMARLEAAAEARDEVAVGKALLAMDWRQRSADDCARGVRLALAAGLPLSARQLATESAKRYPEHVELQKMARVLAPPKVIRSDLPPDPSVKADMDWFKSHSAEYYGQWVAVKNGVLLAAASSAKELKRQVPNPREAVVARILW